jgi:hypothetical protein
MGVDVDEKTLALLLAISNLCGQTHSATHVASVYERSLDQAKDYREHGDQSAEYDGF